MPYKVFVLHFVPVFVTHSYKIISENENLRTKNEKLRMEIKGLKSDPYEIEKIAREKLHLVKSGDQVYHIVQPQKPLPLTP